VHICPDALRVVPGEKVEKVEKVEKAEATMRKVVGFVEGGRTIGLDSWLSRLVAVAH
jgi:hypothetical protein